MQSLGVSVTFLEGFIKEHLTLVKPVTSKSQPNPGDQIQSASRLETRQPEEEPIHMDMFELVQSVIKPQTATKQLRFVELHHGKVDVNGRPLVKEANVFVSYPWSADVRQVLECLVDFASRQSAKLKGRDCYFWLDAFVVNQHASQSSTTPDMLEDYMDKTIRGCGNLLQVLTKWTSPLAFKRLWCVWECFIADRASVPLHFVQPSEEEDLLLKSLLEKGISSSNPIANAYFKLDSRTATATLADDEKVLKAAIEMYIGFAKLNEVIKQQLKKHLVETLKQRLETIPEINNEPVQLAHYGSLISALSISDTKFLVDLFQKCLQLFQNMGKDQWNSDTVMCYTNLGAVCRAGNLTDEALKYLFQALDLEHKRIEVERRKVSNVLADIYFQIGSTYSKVGKFKESLDVLLTANEIYEQLNEDVEQTMKTQRKIAWIYNKMGLFQIAKKVYADIIEFAPDQNMVPVALARSALGDVLVNEGSHYFAAQEVTKAIEILASQMGHQTVLVALNYNKRGEIYRQQGKLSDALADQEKAMDILQQIYGKDHPKTGTTIGYLAAIKNSAGDFESSLDLYFNALEILKGFSTEDTSDDQATVSCQIAGVYMKMKKHDRALETLANALSTRAKLVGEDHPDISPIYFDIAKCHYGLQERKEAVTFCSKCLEIEISSIGEKHPQIGTTFCLLGDIYKDIKKYEPAFEAYSNAYRIWCQSLKSNHPHLKKLKMTMDETLTLVNAKEKRRQELIEASKPSMKNQIRRSGLLKPSAHSLHYSVAKLYDNHDHKKEAVAMYRRFLKSVEFALPEEHPRVVTAKRRIKQINHPDKDNGSMMVKPRSIQT